MVKMTLAEKILAVHSGKDNVRPGDFISVKVDLALTNDVTTPISIKEFRRLDVDKVFDAQKVVVVQDHFTPNSSIQSAIQAKYVREFAQSQNTLYYEVGRGGIEHVLLPEQGLVLPGDLVVGADSHTVTYGALGAFATGMGSTDLAVAWATGEVWMKVPPTLKCIYRGKLGKWLGGKDLIMHTIGDIGVDGATYMAMEFHGEAIDALSMSGRFTMANMAIEAGAKVGLFGVDEKTLKYVEPRARRSFTNYSPDIDAKYEKVIEYDISGLEPQVALPHLPSNVKPVSQVRGVRIDQVVIGCCTNGRLEDLDVAAKILEGRQVDRGVRCIVVPGSQQVYLDALKKGLLESFLEAGAVVSTPTCGPCFGGHMGVLGPGEHAISTTNRNFVGRMGHLESEVYLAGPAVAAASAITGRISSPEEVL